ncbi:zinc finger C2HC domain-containing protein 1A-like isoform X1 [Lytechinus variegatus]|uniref:zinc finger C2HC domain-containing protein 1A-like isoform X1 n=1 Tax=Lytechinus variegatus TaxID=7654 RepID=UPI001BB21BDC|nr:zinc finger C2HC domain-containing protein 1A-like isoform X1 [Lytechinus variegatus]
MDEVPEYGENDDSDLLPCGTCGRTFLPDTLARHSKICRKATVKKRKVFDSSKQRAEGTDIGSVPKTKSPTLPPSKKNNWRQKHEDFIDAMQSAKGVSKAIKTGAPLPPPPSQKRVNPDYVQCPTCERHFSENAAERHIPFCKERNKRIDKKTPNSADKSKVQARTKYKPPLPGSKKKTPSPAVARQPQSRVSTRAGSDRDVSDLENRMNGSMKIGNRTSVRNKPIVGSKARSSSLERPSTKSTSSSYRSSSGDSIRGRSNRQDAAYSPAGYQSGDGRYNYDDDMDYDLPDTRRGSAGRRLEPLYKNNSNHKSSNHVLPHDRLRAVSDDDGFTMSTSRTPTPPSSRPTSNTRKKSADLVNGRRLPKFCHECGTKYPVQNAKYCCECGTRREYLD